MRPTAPGKTFDGAGIPPDIRTGNFVEEIAEGSDDSAFARALAEMRHHAK
ncbi:hypothetical protein ACFYMW_10940 [Streptomyces sp. NPDC006692]